MSWSTLNPSGPMSCSSISAASRCVRCVTSAAAAAAAVAASDAMPRFGGWGRKGAPGAAAVKPGRRRAGGGGRRWGVVGFWRRGEEGKRGRGLVAVAVVRRNGIARERMVVADLSRVLDATASICSATRPTGGNCGIYICIFYLYGTH